jgi:hypothetical protein
VARVKQYIENIPYSAFWPFLIVSTLHSLLSGGRKKRERQSDAGKEQERTLLSSRGEKDCFYSQQADPFISEYLLLRPDRIKLPARCLIMKMLADRLRKIRHSSTIGLREFGKCKLCMNFLMRIHFSCVLHDVKGCESLKELFQS